MDKKRCTLKNPSPPCKEGYEEKHTKKGELCCYRSYKKRKDSESLSPFKKKKYKKKKIILSSSKSNSSSPKIVIIKKSKKLKKNKNIKNKTKMEDHKEGEITPNKATLKIQTFFRTNFHRKRYIGFIKDTGNLEGYIIPKLYDIGNVKGWKKSLKEEGYVVIKNVLPEKDILESFRLFKKDWNTVSPNFNFKDKTTWGIENAPLMYGKGMAIFNGFGQSDFMWNLRLNKNIQNIFMGVHETKDLVVSLDGFSVFLSDKQKSESWLHIDQNPKNKIYSIQGAYNFLPVTEKDAGFVVVPRSHLFYRPDVSHKKDWVKCTSKYYQQKSKKLLIPENCFTLWDSNLIHANEGVSKKTTELNRLTAYITFLPKELRSQKILKDKIEAYQNNKSTSHWAHKCELKRYPWGFGAKYESRGYNTIESTKEDGKVPPGRFNLL
jgi:hypothetical protein